MSMQRTNSRLLRRQFGRAKGPNQAAKSTPSSGVVVNRHDVMGQRYLAVKGFPYSQSVANVPLKGDVP